MAKFVQIIEYRTSRLDELRAQSEQLRSRLQEAGNGVGPLRVTVTADRDRPGYYLSIVEFESYESAMENSNRPETAEFAQRLAELCDGQPMYYNLDVVDVWEPGA